MNNLSIDIEDIESSENIETNHSLIEHVHPSTSTTPAPKPKLSDPFEYTLSIIEGKWKLKILYTLANNEILRYNELKRHLSPITHKMLSMQLKDLEKDGIVIRTEYQQIPPKVEYFLSPKGEDFINIFREMWVWGQKYVNSL